MDKSSFGIQKLELGELTQIRTQKNLWQFLLVSGGSGHIQHQDNILDVSEGFCILSRPLDEFSLVPSLHGVCRLLLFSFSQDDMVPDQFQPGMLRILDEYLNMPQSMSCFQLPEREYGTVRDYLRLCSRLQSDTLAYSRTLFQHALNSLLFYLARSCHFRKPQKKQSSRELSSRSAMIENVKHFINQNYSEALPLSVIAAEVYTNPSYLSRIFKAATGTALSAYLNQVRIGAAKRMLSDTDELIIDIAIDCGFNQVPHFNRVFHSLTGETPTQYRKRHKKMQ